MATSSNILRYYAWRFLAGFFFIYPIQAIYPLSRGITAAQLALFLSTTSILSTLFEIPTGYVADKVSRRWSVALGYLCNGVGYLGYLLIHDIYTMLPLALFFALGKALISGAEEALLYDELKLQEQEPIFLKVTSRGALIGTVSGAIASFTGPLLYLTHASLPFIFTAAANFCLMFFIVTFKETKPTHEVAKEIMMLDGVKHILRRKPLVAIVALEALLLIFVVIHLNFTRNGGEQVNYR